DRRIAYAVTTELVDQSLGDAQHATPRVKLGRIIALRGASDVFAHQDDPRITAHLQTQGFVDGFAVAELSGSHWITSLPVLARGTATAVPRGSSRTRHSGCLRTRAAGSAVRTARHLR